MTITSILFVITILGIVVLSLYQYAKELENKKANKER